MSYDGLDYVRCFERCSVQHESSAFPGEASCLNSKFMLLPLSPDLKTKQHTSGEQDPAGYNVSHGTQGVYQLCWLHQN